MPYQVAFVEKHSSAELTHAGDVDADEITASRLELAACANTHLASGAVINILDAEITANPVEIIDNVEGLLRDFKFNAKLAFVARPEAQATVSMIVATVAHKSGYKVGQFEDLEVARCWIEKDPASAKTCGCEPGH
ncbi:MAG: hypothetical protein GYB36_00845 [Alphaproteobacteria bacterium]|nr:hypothetical protein [Alphaproteobacteria bacterium]